MAARKTGGWSEDDKIRLKELWDEGLSFSEMTRHLDGKTRSACIGQAKRMGLSAKPAPTVTKLIERKPRLTPVVSKPAPVSPEPVIDHEPTPIGLGLEHLRERMCRWPHDDEDSGIVFCGHLTHVPSSYCPYHRALARKPEPVVGRRRFEATTVAAE